VNFRTVDGFPRRWHRGTVTLRPRLGLLGATSFLCVVAGAYLARSGSPRLVEAVVALLALGIAAVRPEWALVAGLSVMALPYTDGPRIPKLGFGFGIVVASLFLAALLPQVRGFRPRGFDWAVLVFAIAPAPIALAQGQPFHLTQWFAPAITVPYFGFRVLFEVAPSSRRLFAPTLVGIGSILSIAGLWESVTGRLAFGHAAQPIYTTAGGFETVWNVPLLRDGHLRAMTTFGHPIAFGMFLVIPLAFALARPGRQYAAASVLMLAAIAASFSRGPWIAAAVVVLLTVRVSRRRAGLLIIVAVFGALVVRPIHHVLWNTGSTASAEGATANYRLGLLSNAFHHLSVFGHPYLNLKAAIPGFSDVTSLYAMTILETGLVGLVALLGLVGVGVRAWRRGVPGGVPLLAQFVGLLSVALITSYQFYFWALVAFVASSEAPLLQHGPDDQDVRGAQGSGLSHRNKCQIAEAR
jgi:hypothetical protein